MEFSLQAARCLGQAEARTPNQNCSFRPNWMFRGGLTEPFQIPKLGLETSVLKAEKALDNPSSPPRPTNVCQLNTLKSSARNCRLTFSVIRVFLMMLRAWL